MTTKRAVTRHFESPLLLVGIGAGGHARCVLDAIRSTIGRFRVIALFDDDERLHGTRVDRVPVIGPVDLQALARGDSGAHTAFVGVGGTGDNAPRQRVFDALDAAGLDLPSITHRTAIVSPLANIGRGAQILAGVIVNAQARIDDNVLVNAGAIVGHDAIVGRDVHIASGAVIGGGVIIGDGAHVGSGATILEGRVVGAGAVVGSGAVVTADVEPGLTVVGVPARALGTSPHRKRRRSGAGWSPYPASRKEARAVTIGS
jgi:UDP-perosamine 4-acetyltransferase